MPSRPVQLAGLSLEPVRQRWYLTASAAPRPQSLPVEERGVNTTTEEADSEDRRGGRSDRIKVAWGDGISTLVAKNKPN